MKKHNTAVILVDGSNLHAACQQLSFMIDYKRFLSVFDERILKAYYFTALPPQTEQSTLRPLTDWLTLNSWTVIDKLWKEFTDAAGNVTKTKGNMDIEIATIAMEAAQSGMVDTIYLV